MANSLVNPLRHAAMKWLVWQIAILIVVTIVCAVAVDAQVAWSAMLGGFCTIAPNAIFAAYAFRFAGARYAKEIYQSFKRGSGLKLLLTMVLVSLCFKFADVVPAPYFGGFLIGIMAQWFVPFFFKS